MSRVIKQLAKIAGIVVVGLILFVGAYKGSQLVKRHFEQQRVANMYQNFRKHGKIRVGKYQYIYLTDYGRQRLQSDMSFKDSKHKKTPATAYIVNHTRQVTFNYVAGTKLPTTIKKGTQLNFEAPFRLERSADFKLKLLADTAKPVKYQTGNISLPAKHNKHGKKLNVIVGYNLDKDSDLIKDLQPLTQHAGQTVTYQIQNEVLTTGKMKKNNFSKLSKAPNIDVPSAWLAKHQLVANFETLKDISNPKPRFKATIDGRDVSHEITLSTKLKTDKHFEKDWQTTFNLSSKLKQAVAESKSKRLKITAAYYGRSVEAYYYDGNNLSGLYEYGH
ncbi:hypothetical protein ACNAN0_10290 [Agrilactobacillus fermenti]|uniref:hypothetical protein n=1 Tax=Agrilactobacillus fermenti TaxID=2586909 RepID=UPI003A5BAC89